MRLARHSAVDLLVLYASHHRDRRNIVTHCVGTPLAVFGLAVLLGRPVWAEGLSLAWLLWALSTAWYLGRGQLLLALAVSALHAVLVSLASPLAASGVGLWLSSGLAALLLGWTLQLAGHYYEGRRPASFDHRVHLLVGPLFVVAEALFALGACLPLRAEIERRAGPTHLRDLTVPAL